VCLIMGSDLICCNLGDARAVLCRDGEAFDLSVDYKASRKDE
jgi:serine/threonine protein phosphatase PrpC